MFFGIVARIANWVTDFFLVLHPLIDQKPLSKLMYLQVHTEVSGLLYYKSIIIEVKVSHYPTFLSLNAFSTHFEHVYVILKHFSWCKTPSSTFITLQ